MAIELQHLSDSSNTAIINAIRNTVGSEFAARVEPATQANMMDTAKSIMRHKPLYNAFLDQLVNRIGSVIVRNNSWTNPLRIFKQGLLEYGDTIEEINTGLVKSKTYDSDRQYLEQEIFGRETPHVEANYHRVNREEYYKITVNDQELRKAFLSSNGLHEFINGLLEAPQTSDNWDEFLMMCQLLPQYEAMGGYFRINVPDMRSISADSADAKQTLREVRAMAQELTFISSKYNAAKMPTAVKPEELILLGTPQFFATIDVEALAGAFNLDRTTAPGRQIAIPDDKFGMTGAQAILTTEKFFVIADRLLENTSADNPVGMYRNYFLHHHQVISQSRFAPAILFHTGADDRSAIAINMPTGLANITLAYRDGTAITAETEVPRGGLFVAYSTVNGTVADDPNDPTGKAIKWSISGNDDPRTRITANGTVHIGGRETSEMVVVKATTTMIDPANPSGTVVHEKTINVLIDGESAMIPEWPAR